MRFVDFRKKYEGRGPAFEPLPAQCTQITAEDGRRELNGTDDSRFVRDVPPLADDDVATGRCLWVIAPTDVPYAGEVCAFAKDQGLDGNAIKHTNLTGGGEAHCAGELWFMGVRTMIINGYSGRSCQSALNFDP